LFRQDLYYRLNVIRMRIPPLSARREDIPLLVEHFIERFNALMRKRIRSVSVDVMNVFMHHPFPGNIRQLQNALEHAAVLCPGSMITMEHLPDDMMRPASKADRQDLHPLPQDPLHAAEARAIRDVLAIHNGNRRRTAQALGISVVTLWRKMKLLGD
jgi:DNA-binding NtrC family response regulator